MKNERKKKFIRKSGYVLRILLLTRTHNAHNRTKKKKKLGIGWCRRIFLFFFFRFITPAMDTSRMRLCKRRTDRLQREHFILAEKLKMSV